MRLSDPDTKLFSLGDASAAAKVDLPLLADWLSRQQVAGASGQPDAAAGPSLTFRQVMRIALASELVKLGFEFDRASRLAGQFTDQGDDAAGVHDDVSMNRREACELYPQGLTLLVACPEAGTGEVVNVRRNAGLQNLMATYGWSEDSIAVVNVNAVDRRLRSAVG